MWMLLIGTLSIKPWKGASVSDMKRLLAAILSLPLVCVTAQAEARVRFEPAPGSEARFLARGAGYRLSITPTQLELALNHAQLRLRWIGARKDARIEAIEPLPGRINYISGRDPSRWRIGVPTFARVLCRGVYPGIDLVYYGNQGNLEYDLVVQPGADVRAVRLRLKGARSGGGGLVLGLGDGEVRLQRPHAYQSIEGSRRVVPVTYRFFGNGDIGFSVGRYDRRRALIVDPVLVYSSYHGGSGADRARAIAVDSTGNAFVTGSTTSANFAVIGSPFDSTLGGSTDAFVSKISPTGTLLYSTYLGGGSSDSGLGLALDPNGNVYVTGSTTSSDFPATAGVAQPTFGGGTDAFVTKLGSDGRPAYSTYLGGAGNENLDGTNLVFFTSAGAIAVDTQGNAYVTGVAGSGFPTTAGAMQSTSGGGTFSQDAFVAKLSTGGTLAYSTYFGGNGIDTGYAIAVDSAGNAWIAGRTTSSNLTTTSGALRTALGSVLAGFLLKLSSTGSLQYSTYLGGNDGNTDGLSVAVDGSGNCYVAGATSSTSFPTTAGALHRTRRGDNDAFLSKFSSVGALVYSTLLGGSGHENQLFNLEEGGASIKVDSSGNVTFLGSTRSSDIPVTSDAIQVAPGSNGLFSTSNGGTTWNATGLPHNPSVASLAIDPTDSMTLYVSSRDDIVKSTNGGQTWISSKNGIMAGADPLSITLGIRTLAINPQSSSTLYVATTVGVFKSTNGGASWTASSSGIPAGVGGSVNIQTLAIDPLNPNNLYAGYQSQPGAGPTLFRSTNGGASWSSAGSEITLTPVNVIAIDPKTPATLYVAVGSTFGAGGLFKSTNAGTSWLTANNGLAASPDIRAIAIDPVTPSTLYVGIASGGVFKSVNSGALWTAVNTGLTNLAVRGLAVDPNAPSTVYAATTGGVFKSTDAGASWGLTGLSVSVTLLAFERGTSSKLYAATAPTADAFIEKLNATGSAVLFASYLGGVADDVGRSLALDSSGNIHVAGETESRDFPLRGAFQAAIGATGSDDGFVAKIGLGGGTTSHSFSLVDRSGISLASSGSAQKIDVGYARIQANGGSTTPAGLAIFGLRQNGVLVTEAGVPASPLVREGRIFAEVGGSTNTGLAIANPNDQPTTISYFYTDLDGNNFDNGSFNLGAREQKAAFLNEPPFNGRSSLLGTFTFSSSLPVAAIALRGFNNEENSFLITTLPVAELGSTLTSTAIFPHFADGDGWVTQLILVNSTDQTITGVIDFLGQGSGSTPAQPALVTIDGQSASTFAYAIPARSMRRFRTSGSSATIAAGSIRVTPSSGRTPSGLGIFSFRQGGVTVTEAGVPALPAARAQRMYAEFSGPIQTGVAVANVAADAVTVRFEANSFSNPASVISGQLTVPGNGQVAKFLREIPGLEGLPDGFQGVLRISTDAPQGVSVLGLRGRTNESNRFLITTTPPVDENKAASSSEMLFPHFVSGGGYTTQFILFSGALGQASSGILRFFNQAGEALVIAVQ